MTREAPPAFGLLGTHWGVLCLGLGDFGIKTGLSKAGEEIIIFFLSLAVTLGSKFQVLFIHI